MNTDETLEFENRVYVNPDVSRNEQLAFVDTLRDLQAQKNAQIATETHNLGTDVPSNLGGLSGSEEYWQGKYQTPQTEALVANMKAVAQQSALNTALQNYQDALKEKYNQAYRNYQKRAYNYGMRSSSGGSSGGGSTEGGVDYTDTTSETYKGQGTLNVTNNKQANGTNRVAISDPVSGYTYTWDYPIGSNDDSQRKLVNTDDPAYYRGSDGYMYRSGSSSGKKNLSVNTSLSAGLGLINNLGRR